MTQILDMHIISNEMVNHPFRQVRVEDEDKRHYSITFHMQFPTAQVHSVSVFNGKGDRGPALFHPDHLTQAIMLARMVI